MIRVGEVVHMLENLTSAIEGGLVAPVQLQRVQELVTSAQALTQVRRLLVGFAVLWIVVVDHPVSSALLCCHPARRVITASGKAECIRASIAGLLLYEAMCGAHWEMR